MNDDSHQWSFFDSKPEFGRSCQKKRLYLAGFYFPAGLKITNVELSQPFSMASSVVRGAIEFTKVNFTTEVDFEAISTNAPIGFNECTFEKGLN